jgi:Zn-dependent protease/CBS domain-containing protein
MNGSWRIGKIAGIDVYVHFTFLILLGWVGWVSYDPRLPVSSVAIGMAYIGVLFGIVVLHELGHALAARRYGIATRDITLLPIGGVARLERMPDDPKQELVVALAGPAVNVVLAASLFAGLYLGGEVRSWNVLTNPGVTIVNQLMWVNVILAVFNMIPAFPMDGGRVLRALLALRMDYVRATATAASIGQAIAVLFAVAGIFLNPMLIFIALFVWLGADAEARYVALGSSLSGVPVQNAMITRLVALAPTHTIADAVAAAQDGFQQDFPVVEAGQLVGLVPRQLLLQKVKENALDVPVADVMQTRFVTADPNQMLARVRELLGEEDVDVVPVVRGGRLCGLVTAESLGRYLLLRKVMQPKAPAAAANEE